MNFWYFRIIVTKLDFLKKQNNFEHLLTPKMFLRFAPGSMRFEIQAEQRLNSLNAFSLDRLDNKNNYETGVSGTLGFDYKIKNKEKEFDFSVAQIINEKENKKWQNYQFKLKTFRLSGTSSLKLKTNLN